MYFWVLTVFSIFVCLFLVGGLFFPAPLTLVHSASWACSPVGLLGFVGSSVSLVLLVDKFENLKLLFSYRYFLVAVVAWAAPISSPCCLLFVLTFLRTGAYACLGGACLAVDNFLPGVWSWPFYIRRSL